MYARGRRLPSKLQSRNRRPELRSTPQQVMFQISAQPSASESHCAPRCSVCVSMRSRKLGGRGDRCRRFMVARSSLAFSDVRSADALPDAPMACAGSHVRSLLPPQSTRNSHSPMHFGTRRAASSPFISHRSVVSRCDGSAAARSAAAASARRALTVSSLASASRTLSCSRCSMSSRVLLPPFDLASSSACRGNLARLARASLSSVCAALASVRSVRASAAADDGGGCACASVSQSAPPSTSHAAHSPSSRTLLGHSLPPYSCTGTACLMMHARLLWIPGGAPFFSVKLNACG